MIGTLVAGRYRVEAVIGAGAFATVHRALDERLDTVVALKVLAENHSLDPDIRDRFINEARRLRRVASPHVIGVHDLGETDRQQPFIVMDLADRGDLAARVAAVRAGGRLPGPADAEALATAVAGALGAMHARRVVHRDLTPRNLLLRSVPGDHAALPGAVVVGPGEQLVVGDLGLSKDLALASGITAAAGTPGFFPPEQRAGAGIDERTDVYAASALLVWLATGRPPAEDGSWDEAALAEWPPGVAVALGRGLARAPGERQPSAAAWRAELASALAPSERVATLPVLDPPPTPAAVGDGPPTVGGPRRRLALAAVLVAALACMGLGLVVGRWTSDDAASTSEVVVDGGRARAEGAMGVVVEGPAELTVDELATFSIDPGEATSWAWIGPDGRITPDAQVLDVTASSAGRVLVTLVATDEVGRTSRIVLPVEAVDG